MISQSNSSQVRATYASNLGESKSAKASTNTSVSKQGDTSKIDQIKEALVSGEYKVDLDALSKKIAEELL
ncbi:MAG: flagellar biosynthesis anti-sigma factor FlgM [Sulfurimonas sp.]